MNTRSSIPARPLHIVMFFLLAALLVLPAVNVHAETESECIALLQSDADTLQKCEACRMLRLVGTVQSVPALGSQLTEDRVSQAARYALEGISAPEATRALRDALVRTSGHLKVGIVDSLGWKRDAASVGALTLLLADTDTTVAAAAATALGRIGGKAAFEALSTARSTAPPAVRSAVVEGLLRGAEQLLAEGKPLEARTLYESLADTSESEHIRVAAYAGWIRASGSDGLAPIVSALEGSDAAAQTAALQMACGIRSSEATRAFVTLLPQSPPKLKVALLAIVQQWDDVSALPSVLTEVHDPNPDVRAAALAALGQLGDADVIPVLAQAAVSGDATGQRRAREALVTLRRGDITGTLVSRLNTSEPAVQAELVWALTERADKSAVPGLLELAHNDRPAVRNAALQALAGLADGTDIAMLVKLLREVQDADAKTAVVGVFEAVAEREDGAATDVEPIVHRMGSGDVEDRVALLQVAVLFADARLRAPLRSELKEDNDRIRAAANRALCDVRDPALLPDLMEVARQTADPGLRALAIAGVVRLVTQEQTTLSVAQRTKALTTVFALASRTEDKWRVLSGLARVPDVTTLALAQQASADPAVREEAELACFQIAQHLGSAEFEMVEPVLNHLAAGAGSPAVRTNAQALLRILDSGWLYAGPYRQNGKEAQQLFDIPFAPEQQATDVKWQRAPGSASDTRRGEVDLSGIVRGDHCVVYLKTRVYTPVADAVQFWVGSDDGVQLWVNGERVHAHNAVRGLTPDEDKVVGRLRQGWNELLAKVTQHTLGCGMILRIRQPDGSDVPGLRIDPMGGLARLETGFERLQLTDQFYAEGASTGDFNRDGNTDVVAGPFWFAGPHFAEQHEYRPARRFSPRDYSDNFLTYTDDCNDDGWTDIVCVPFPGREGYWYENPRGQPGHWRQHLYYPMVGNESPVWGDVNGDSRPELLFCNEGFLGYAGPNSARPYEPWRFHAISQRNDRYQRFTHGIGHGDINGDARVDLVEAMGWWEQPTDVQPDQPWVFHAHRFAEAGAQMLVDDVDGDGAADIITAWHCHQYGLVWWRQVRRAGQPPDWTRQVILSPTPDPALPDLRVSQMHALALADMNGDGLKDIVTGKRFWAHGPAGDPEPNAPPVVYWFELRRAPGGAATYIPHLIDDDSGVGTQVATDDLNKDGRPDVVVANKKGVFLHLSQARSNLH